MAYARAASVGEDDTTGLLEDLGDTVTSDGGTDLFGSGGDDERGLSLQAMLGGLTADGGGSGHVLVGGVGTASDQTDLHFLGPGVLGDGLLQGANGVGPIRSERTVEVRLEGGEVNLDDFIVLEVSIAAEIVLERLGKRGNLGSSGGSQVVSHALVVREDRSSSCVK